MKKYLVTKYNDEKNPPFTCLYEIDPDHEKTYTGLVTRVKDYRILKVVVGSGKLEYAKRKDFFGVEFYEWKWKRVNIYSHAYYIEGEPGFEIFEVEDDEQALLYYKLNY